MPVEVIFHGYKFMDDFTDKVALENLQSFMIYCCAAAKVKKMHVYFYQEKYDSIADYSWMTAFYAAVMKLPRLVYTG